MAWRIDCLLSSAYGLKTQKYFVFARKTSLRLAEYVSEQEQLLLQIQNKNLASLHVLIDLTTDLIKRFHIIFQMEDSEDISI